MQDGLNGRARTASRSREISRGEIEVGEVYAVGTEPVSFGDVVDVDTVSVVGVVAVVAEEEDVFLVCATADDASPRGLVVFFGFFGRDVFVVGHCLDFICDGIGS